MAIGGKIDLHQERVAAHLRDRDDLGNAPFELAMLGRDGDVIAGFSIGDILLRKACFQTISCCVLHRQHGCAGHHHCPRIYRFRGHDAVEG